MSALERLFHDRLVGLPSDLAGVLAAAVLAERSVLILGEHGTGKTTFCAAVADAMGLAPDEWVYYDAAKDDLVSICGFPNTAAMRQGRVEFACHERTAWNKHLLLIDEITRATPENQNLWLEIVDRRTLMGRPLAYRFLVATCNPDEYASTYQLDAALLDRFTIVCRFPDLRDAGLQTLEFVVQANWEDDRPERGPGEWIGSVSDLKEEFLRARSKLARDRRIQTTVARWCARFVRALHDIAEDVRVSNRTLGRHLPNSVLDLLAYHNAQGRRIPLGTVMERAARFTLQTRLDIEPRITDNALELARSAVDNPNLPPHDSDLVVVLSPPKAARIDEMLHAFQRLREADLTQEERERVEMAARNVAFSDETTPRQMELLRDVTRSLELPVCKEIEIALIKQAVESEIGAFESSSP